MSLAVALGASTTTGDGSDFSVAAIVGIAIGVLIYLAIIAVGIWAYVRVAQKAGYSGWWVLILLVPIANIVFALMFAFKQWPIERELEYLRGRVAQLEGPAGYGALPPGQQPGALPPGQQPGQLPPGAGAP